MHRQTGRRVFPLVRVIFPAASHSQGKPRKGNIMGLMSKAREKVDVAISQPIRNATMIGILGVILAGIAILIAITR
jgi:hypothetical protein